MTARCPHCGRDVVEACMRGTGRTVLLDPEPHARGNLHLIELGHVVTFIPPEHRDPNKPGFVPPAERYQSHRATCPQNERTCAPETRAFIDEVDRRLGART